MQEAALVGEMDGAGNGGRQLRRRIGVICRLLLLFSA